MSDPHQINESVEFLDETLSLLFALVEDLADTETKETMKDLRDAHETHRMVLQDAGLLETPAPEEIVTPAEPTPETQP